MADRQEPCSPSTRQYAMSAKKSVHVRRFAADSIVVELVVVSRASEELETIVQSRCLELTWTDIYSTNATQQYNAIICLALQLDKYI